MSRKSALMLTFALLATLAGASCVPAGEELAPKGAAGLITEPSPATRGEPFLTDDGWSVRIDRLALITHSSASTSTSEEEENARYMWNGAAPTELLVRAVPVGPCAITVELQGAGRRFENGVEVPTYVNLGVEPSLEARFKLFEEIDPPRGPGPKVPPGPSVVIIARGEKGGLVVVLDVALTTSPPSSPDPKMTTPNVDVRANDVTFAHLDVAAERIFAVDTATRRGAAFQPIADADARGDGDGRVTDAELRAVSATCDACPETSTGEGPTLLDRITFLAAQVLTAH